MTKYNLSKIMSRAWEIKRQDSRYIFGMCLQMAWDEVKTAAAGTRWDDIEIGELICYHSSGARFFKTDADEMSIIRCGKLISSKSTVGQEEKLAAAYDATRKAVETESELKSYRNDVKTHRVVRVTYYEFKHGLFGVSKIENSYNKENKTIMVELYTA